MHVLGCGFGSCGDLKKQAKGFYFDPCICLCVKHLSSLHTYMNSSTHFALLADHAPHPPSALHTTVYDPIHVIIAHPKTYAISHAPLLPQDPSDNQAHQAITRPAIYAHKSCTITYYTKRGFQLWSPFICALDHLSTHVILVMSEWHVAPIYVHERDADGCLYVRTYVCWSRVPPLTKSDVKIK